MKNALLTAAATALLMAGGLVFTESADARPWRYRAPVVRYYGYRPYHYYGYVGPRYYVYRGYYAYPRYYYPRYYYPRYYGGGVCFRLPRVGVYYYY
jgi:hypothetical protein